MEYRYKIIEFSNYDGDSFNLSLDLGFSMSLYRKCRLYGVDTPELRGGTVLSKAAGRLARDEATQWTQDAMLDGGAAFLSENYSGKFGRPLGDIIRLSDGGSLREFLIDSSLGVEYHGQAKADVASEHKANLDRLIAQNKLAQ